MGRMSVVTLLRKSKVIDLPLGVRELVLGVCEVIPLPPHLLDQRCILKAIVVYPIMPQHLPNLLQLPKCPLLLPPLTPQLSLSLLQLYTDLLIGVILLSQLDMDIGVTLRDVAGASLFPSEELSLDDLVLLLFEGCLHQEGVDLFLLHLKDLAYLYLVGLE